ncbi:MAG TPA: NAD-dependent epimerase/dehydratase family protein [Chloroflexota bacterium]
MSSSPYKTILVTGGAGFVGSNLAIWFQRAYPDTHVIAADNLKRRGTEVNLPRLRQEGIEFVHCDIRNAEDLSFEQGVDLILECSAEPSVLAGYGQSPAYLINTNLMGTINCLELARRSGADFVFLSTSRVYPIEALNSLGTIELDSRFALTQDQPLPGVSEHGIGERFPLEGSRSLYGATKLCSELLIQEYGAMYGVRFIINRCGVITGPWQMGKVDQGVFALWMAHHYFRRGLSYIGWGGQGKQVRDLLDVDDLTDLLAIQLSRFSPLAGQTFNVGGGLDCSLSLLETTRLCQEITGNVVPIEKVPENRPADVKVYVSDNRHITETVGWLPHRTPRDTLTRLFDWFTESEPLIRHLWTA